MQHTANNVYSVFGGLEMLVNFDVRSIGILDFNIVPGIDIYFLDPRAENIFRQKRKLSHFRVELVDQFRLCKPLDGNTVIEQIFPDIPLDLLLDIIVTRIYVIDPVDHQHGIFA